jgi:putative selenium metabolism hydrolase
MNEIIAELNQRVAAAKENILTFFRDIVAIPSMDNDIEEVGRRVGEEMSRLGFDAVYVDRFGSIVGRIGDGDKILLYDSHLDTVGIGDPAQWEWDPFRGKEEDGLLYARGALDEKGSTPGMVYGLAMAREMGLLDGFTAYYLGNIEEWCDGIACQAFVEWEGIKPDFVVVGEPTRMQVYRGHKGRVELEVIAKGVSAHAASNQMGDNAIYKMLPVITGVAELNEQLPNHEFLGQGRITVTRIGSVSPSDNAVPDECRIFIDRRITFGETKEGVIAQIQALIPRNQADNFEIQELVYDTPSHTGAVFIYEKFFPAWAMDEDDPFVRAGQSARQALWNLTGPAGKWEFSTNGNYWRGKLGVPSIGFGPGNEIFAHAVNEHVPLDEVVEATKFYALLPYFLKGDA